MISSPRDIGGTNTRGSSFICLLPIAVGLPHCIGLKEPFWGIVMLPRRFTFNEDSGGIGRWLLQCYVGRYK
jgi:hypothetical protein